MHGFSSSQRASQRRSRSTWRATSGVLFCKAGSRCWTNGWSSWRRTRSQSRSTPGPWSSSLRTRRKTGSRTTLTLMASGRPSSTTLLRPAAQRADGADRHP
eukprot:Amastigsp_a177340_35.p4 type:complete len:101 gc:universal Amastigsp_a177340_35:539-841(+)